MIWCNAGRLLLGTALVYTVLILPNFPPELTPSALKRFPLELPVILLAMVAVGRSRVWARALAIVLAITLTLVLMMKLADLAMFTAYQRPFNPLVDLSLSRAAVNLAIDVVGPVMGVGAVVILVVLVALVCAGIAWGLLGVALRAATKRHCQAAALGTLVAAVVLAVDVTHRFGTWEQAVNPPGTSHTTWLIVRRVDMVENTALRLAAFRDAASKDPYVTDRPVLDLIGDRDVLVIFVESYGRASFDHPAYAATHLPILSRAQGDLHAAGLAMRSGWLTSPTAGGQSWLAHGTLATGLWTVDTGTYRAMLKSGRKGLFHLAQDAGFRTNAVMPAITAPWPESAKMGFDQVFEAADMDYVGPSLNWVTMPDQYTLSAYGRLLGDDGRRDFTQVALISSHAPWTPVLPVLSWDVISDGTIFHTWDDTRPSPREVWADRDRVRDHYRQSVAYSLEVALQHITRIAHEGPLVLLVGDHQPTEFVAMGPSHDVAMHLIGPPEIVAQTAPWDWTPGLIPDSDLPPWPMDSFRDRFLDAFSSPPETVGLGG